jgi:hypothetical protein
MSTLGMDTQAIQSPPAGHFTNAYGFPEVAREAANGCHLSAVDTPQKSDSRA